jgi:Cu2+-exporting ATPase
MPGHGVQARDAQGRLWRLGARDWVQLDGLEQACTVDSTSVWCGPDGLAWARFDFDEQLRPDAAAAVAELVAAGVQVTVLSGDRPERVARLQRALPGADTGQGGASPEQKLAAVAVAQARGEVVGMVGDGINDAPVLARADVAFAMGHSGLLTKTQADAVITSGRWADLVWARDRARLTLRVIRQNLLWALAYNAACVPLALGGFLPPWAAGLGMACSSLFVVANSGRLSRFSRPAD